MINRLATTAPDFTAALAALLAARATATDVAAPVAAILARIRTEGDAALLDLTEQFDRFKTTAAQLAITPAETAAALAALPAEQRDALDLAAHRIEAFHRAQLPQNLAYTDDQGVTLGMRWTPLDAVGLYVPGGKASYPSSVLMNAIPARVAGVARIAMTVPTPDGVTNDLVLAAAHRAGITEIYRVGGAQAVAALAYGTATIAPVDRIVGPGNAYVAEAKRQVFGRVGIDSIAGPSEVLIIADADNNPHHIALDLLAQAEHAEDSQSILITESPTLADAVAAAITTVLQTLPRATIAAASLAAHGAIILATDRAETIALTNHIAPEHLQIMTADPEADLATIRHAGSIFLGRHAPTAIGDYAAGPNHVLPTAGTARFSSGLSVFDFLKRTTTTSLTAASLATIGPAAIVLANAEHLEGHGQSILARINIAVAC